VLRRLFRRDAFAEPALALYRAAVAQGRDPAFYRDQAVPDTVDGRFELIGLHVWLLLRRLRQAGAPAEVLAQDLVEIFFADMDVSLRELGAADIGVGRRVKRMIEGFYGRAGAYDAALAAGGPGPLAAALERNLYGTRPPPPAALGAVVDYVGAAVRALDAADAAALLAGRVAFPPPPAGASR